MSKLYALVTGGLLVAIPAGTAWAQDRAADQIATDDLAIIAEVAEEEAAPQNTRPMLDEIVVTAQKRAESIQDVPLSVSAIGGETLREKAIETLDDVALHTPNTKIATSNAMGSSMKMRGLGSGANKGFEQSVGLVIDGVYYGRIEYMTTALLDVAQIEIMRGPQGTLMGKNAIAGVVSINSAKPNYDWEADLAYGMGELEKSTLTGIVNVPVVDDVLAVRLAVQRDRRDGYVENTHLNYDQANTYRDTIRGKVAFDGVENLSVVASVESSLLKQRLWGFEINKATDQTRALYSTFDEGFEADVNRKNQSDQDGDARKTNLTASLKADYDIGEYTLTSVTGWSHLTSYSKFDADFSPAPLITLLADDEWTQYSQEFRITSPIDVIDYVAGLYVFGSKFDNFSDIAFLEGVDPATLASSAILPGLVANVLPGVTGPVAEDHSLAVFYQDAFSIAGFGQVRWHLFDDALTLMAGLRYSYEVKEASMWRDFTGPGVFFIAGMGQEEFDIPTQKRIERDISPKLSVAYAVNDDLNIYATYAQAFKGGGFNAASVTAGDFEFEGEKAGTYELGLKGKLLDGMLRANIAAFYTSFENLQVSIYNGTVFVVRNAADATTKGVEADLTAVLSEGLFLNFSLGYTNARYDSFLNGPCQNGQAEPCDLTGKPLDGAPDWNGSFGASYTLPIGTLPFEIMIGGDANYQSKYWVNTDLDPNEMQDAHFIYNARLALQDVGDMWQMQISAKNLSDEDVLVIGADLPAQNGSHVGSYAAPRLISAEFRVRF